MASLTLIHLPSSFLRAGYARTRSPASRPSRVERGLTSTDFLIRLVPKIVTPSLPPHYPPSPYTPNADSSNNTAHPPSRSDTHFILCPSNILHNPSPPAPSTFKGRGVWVQCHRSTIAQLSHKGPHLGPLGRFPPPDQSSASTTAPLSSGARAGSPIGKSGLSTTKGGTIGPGLFVPPYLAEQVYEQLCERVLQEMARLASRPGLRRSNASDRGLGRGAQEKVVPDGRGRDPKWGLLRLLDPTEGKFWAGSSQKARQGRHEASEPAVGSDGAARNSLVQPTVAGILDTAGLNTLLPPTPPALNPELRPGDAAHCRGPKSGTPTLPGLVYPPLSVHPPPSPSHAPTSEGDASSTPKSDPIPIPTFHLASLFPATHHATLAGHLDRLVSCSNADDQAGDGETTTSDLGSGTSKQDITQDTPSGLIAVQIVTPQYGTSSDMNRVVDSTAGRNKRSAGEVQSESKGSLAGTGAGDKGDVRGLDLVKALWRLKLWSGQGWGEQS